MFVLTVDQRRSRETSDRVLTTLVKIKKIGGDRLLRYPIRTVGDELQAITDDPACAFDLIIALHREGGWSIGLGVGWIEIPMPPDPRDARGLAFVAARDAVERAKSRQTRFALTGDDTSAEDAEALMDLLLVIRSARTPQGWEVFDSIEAGRSQRQVSESLGITPQSVSDRVRAANVRQELTARPVLVSILADAERQSREV